MNKSIFILMIPILSMAVIRLYCQQKPGWRPRDTLAEQVAITDGLIAARDSLLDSIARYKQVLEFQYRLKKGRPYEVVHRIGQRFRVFHYRIAEVDPDRKGKDTVFVGATTEK